MKEQEAIKIFKDRLELTDYRKQVPEYYEAMELAVKALEKQIPKKIIGTEEFPVYVGDTVSGICPECMTDYVCITPRMYKEKGLGYCKECGQKLDLGEEE